ncbi:MAG: hypothetical protein IT374_04235 [Polyangiaceae bacterium]|nr:hypothetical protein [Polyangiaceae bacterium]
MSPPDDVAPPPTSGAPEFREPPFLVGLMFLTAATLGLEVLFTRLLSVLTWYSLAFLVIGMGMFGLTVGAVRVYLAADDYAPERLAQTLARDSLRFAIATPVAYTLLLVVPLRVAPVWTTVPLFLAFAALIALPFIPAGMVVAGAITRAPIAPGRVYAVDLAGAALGAPLVPELLERMSCGAAIFVMAAAGAAASAAFSLSSGKIGAQRRGVVVAVALGALALVDVGGGRMLVPLWAKGKAEDAGNSAFDAWNSHSRVQVSQSAVQPAALWGAGRKCRIPRVRQRMIVIDADAATPLYQPDHSLDELAFLGCDVTNIAHHLRPGGAAAVIGVGGSRDIQAALLFQHAPVYGIEMNRRLLEVLKGPLGAPTLVATHPDVKLVHDEARSFLSRSKLQVRVLQASLIDTWAATGAGAHALGENGLYTLEAWRTFLDRLEPGGVLTMSRWSSGETTRVVSLAVAALLSRGVASPREHIALVQGGPVTTIVVGRDPLTAEDGELLRRVADEKGFVVLLGPGMKLPDGHILTDVLTATTRARLDEVTLLPALDYRPPTDEKPFFFNVIRLSAFGATPPPAMSGTIEGNRVATRALVLSLFSTVALSLAAIVVPLVRRARPAGRITRELRASLAYFGLIGLGFMMAEVGLLQRLSLVLGHPTYSLIVVLAALVAAAGLGSYVSDGWAIDREPLCYVYPVVIAGVLLALSHLMPIVAPKIQPLDVRSRIAISGAIAAASGFVMGFGFPGGMRLVRATQGEETPWLWGINGVGGVVGSSLAVVVALEAGLTSLFFAAALCYLALLPLIRVLRAGAAT